MAIAEGYVVENLVFMLMQTQWVLFCLWKFPIHLCNAKFEATLLNLWMLRKLCLREQDDYVVENFLGEYVVENLISNVNANVLCYFVCGNSLYICVMHHLKPLFLIVGCWGNYVPPVFSSEMCTLIYYTHLSHFLWLCLYGSIYRKNMIHMIQKVLRLLYCHFWERGQR